MQDSGRSLREPTRRALLELHLKELRAERAVPDQIRPLERGGYLPLSFAQQRLWFRDQLAPALWNVPVALRLRGHLDVGALEEALSRIVERHESLRTRFGSERGVPFQVIDPPWPVRPAVEDLTGVPADQREQQALARAAVLGREPFALGQGRLLRAHLLLLGEREHVLVLAAHQLVTDEWSVSVLLNELAVLYEAARRQVAAPLAPPAVQYADYAVWQRRQLAGRALEEHLAYWSRQLAGLATLEFPTDRPWPAAPRYAGDLVERALPAELRAGLAGLARRERVSLLTVLLAAFQALLGRYCEQDDVVVGSASAGRTRPQLEPLIGFFANTLPVRTSLAGDPPFRELLRRVSETVLGAQAHQDVPLDKLVERLRPEQGPGRSPFFQISLALHSGTTLSRRFGGLEAERMLLSTGTARLDLAVSLLERSDGGLLVMAEHSTELFERGRLERLLGHYQVVLDGIVRDPEVRLSRLPVLTAGERRQVLVEWNPPGQAGPAQGRLLHELVERQAAVRPRQVACRFQGRGVSYGELDRRANWLAWRLREGHGVGPETIVGLLVERGVELPLGMLGALKAGGAWLPLDPTHPPRRLALLVEDARCPVVVTTGQLAGRLPGGVARVCLDDPGMRQELAAGMGKPPPPAGHARNLAYVIYTSGSTGTPKGVLIEHGSVVDFVTTCQRLFSVTPADRVLQFANPAFDVSVFETFAALASGATLVQAPREVLLDPAGLSRLLQAERVSVTDMAPAVMALLDGGAFPDLRVAFVGGEAFSGELVDDWNRPGRQFHNGYGPTEATVTVVDYACPKVPHTASPPIGRAMANHRAYVLDRHGGLMPVGVPGELHIGGAGLARGYLGRPDLTAERFVPDPFGPAGQRLYRTGDLAQWRPDGQLEFLGRIDRQVKIRGVRIELGEIEHQVVRHPAVQAAAVTTWSGGRGGPRLAAYVVPAVAGSPPGSQELHAFLAAALPVHMLPSVYVTVEALPLTPSGKLDQARLPRPEPDQDRERDREPERDRERVAATAAPGTATERTLAELWREILDLGPGRLGVHDNFFMMGGNSLQATQLLMRVNEAFQVRTDLRVLYANATVHQLATQIDQAGRRGQGGAARAALTPITPAGSCPPFFCVHASGGTVSPYVPLANALDPEQPFYGLEAIGIDGRGEPRTRVEDMAAGYLEAVRSVQPSGPYRLGGWSTGGAVAFEMACQLHDRGEEVALLALLDANVPQAPYEPPPVEAMLCSFLRDLGGVLGRKPPTLTEEELRGLPLQEQVKVVVRRAGEAGLRADGSGTERLLRDRIPVFLANLVAFFTYKPHCYSGEITLLRAAESEFPSQGWRHLAGGLVEHVLAGDHYSIFRPSQVGALAATLQDCLARALPHPRHALRPPGP